MKKLPYGISDYGKIVENNYIMVEFKYLKKAEENKLKEKQKKAKEQIERYSKIEEIKDVEKMNKYTIATVNDKIYVEKID